MRMLDPHRPTPEHLLADAVAATEEVLALRISDLRAGRELIRRAKLGRTNLSMTSAPLALASSQFGLQCVERLVPGATELIKPAVELGQAPASSA